jgi:hypothetical protein
VADVDVLPDRAGPPRPFEQDALRRDQLTPELTDGRLHAGRLGQGLVERLVQQGLLDHVREEPENASLVGKWR